MRRHSSTAIIDQTSPNIESVAKQRFQYLGLKRSKNKRHAMRAFCFDD